ncbi:hypothetical protein BASA81_010150 [Batrachochytrium salamandrivorans]|nr:hypothetical protein BASA81_010150 [Batrachochytrium salamandrivorans]
MSASSPPSSSFWAAEGAEQITPEFLASLAATDPIAVLLEFKHRGVLDAILRGDQPPSEKQGEGEDRKLFLAVQVVCRYLSQTIRGFSLREQQLQTLLHQAEEEIRLNHYQFSLLKKQRKQVVLDRQRVEEEIAHCDRVLKSHHRHSSDYTSEEEDENDSPWEDHHHRFTSFPSMHMASPMNINHVFNHSFFHHHPSPAIESISSPKQAGGGRSRASSESSTQGGMMSEDELVLFNTIGVGSNAWEKVKDAAILLQQQQQRKSKLEGINEVPIIENAEEEEEEQEE